ncbi:sodium-dependent glucose transporter 1 [Dromiciops gliroides]|uniref:sodium-dependent glucose transporter 1 n=1 Tax=Dromiciops gliroides TaxID=33562 RepID=UPI001CC544EE|nr:sodium-dependent glucose transporter 1 [Dromiciops gliroides]
MWAGLVREDRTRGAASGLSSNPTNFRQGGVLKPCVLARRRRGACALSPAGSAWAGDPTVSRALAEDGACGPRGSLAPAAPCRCGCFSGAAELEELELERGGAPAPAPAGQRLLPAGPSEAGEPLGTDAEVYVVGGDGGGGGRCGAGNVLRWFTSLVVCAAFLGLGLNIAIVGPTLQDLAINVNRNISDISYIFVGRACGFLSGSVIGGFLFDHVNHNLILGFSMLGTSIGLYLVPFFKKTILLVVMMAVFGISAGVLDTSGNVLILKIWRGEAAPHLQALHFTFALGAFLAPLLAKLVLGSTGPSENHMIADTSNYSELTLPPAADLEAIFGVPANKNLLWAYIVIGTYILVVCSFFVVLFFQKIPNQEKTKATAERSQTAKYQNALLGLLFIFFFFYVGAEVTYGSYVFSFATLHAGMSESQAAGLNSAFWGMFAACRGMAICFATCMRPGTMIVLSNVGSLISSLFLLIFNKNHICLWVATAVYGASMATTFPSGISWLEQYVTIKGKSAALFVIGASLGEMVIPAVVGALQGKYPHLPGILYVSLGSAIATGVLFPVMYKLATAPLDSKIRESRKSEDQKALLSTSGFNDDDDGDGEEGAEEEWNKADFEMIEMNDTMGNSVIETSRKILRESPTEISNQLLSDDIQFSSSLFITGNSPVKPLTLDREKND